MKELANELGLIKVCTSPYRPQSNSVLECAHGFVKQSLTQIVTNHQVEGDMVHHIVEMAYNVFPTRANRESPFFLMFQRDCYIPTLMQLLQPKLRYAGDEHMKVSFDALHELYMMNLLTLKRARDHMPNLKKLYDTPSFTVGDLVLLKNHNSSALQTKYLPNYRIVKKIGDQAVDL